MRKPQHASPQEEVDQNIVLDLMKRAADLQEMRYGAFFLALLFALLAYLVIYGALYELNLFPYLAAWQKMIDQAWRGLALYATSFLVLDRFYYQKRLLAKVDELHWLFRQDERYWSALGYLQKREPRVAKRIMEMKYVVGEGPK